MKFIFAEKPMVAERYAAFVGGVMLSNGEELTFSLLEDKNKENLVKMARRKGYFESKNGYIISYAEGHMYELKNPEEFRTEWKAWQRSTLPMIPDGFVDFAVKQLYKPKERLKERIKVILQQMKEADQIIVATDNDREGESIFRIPYIFSGSKKPFVRAWLQDQTPEKIAKVFLNLEDGHKYDGWWYASIARSLSDWLVGMNITRSMTIQSHSLIHVGRVKTPTLAIVVNRDEQIANFEPENFYELMAKLQSESQEEFSMTYDSQETIKNRKKLEDILTVLSATTKGTVKSVESKVEKNYAPNLYSLTSLTKDASRILKFDAQKTLETAQNLYMVHQAISYPRTDCEYLPSTMETEIGTVLTNLMRTKEYGQHAVHFKKPSLKYMNDAKMDGAHYAIIPTVKSVQRDKLSDDEWNLYHLIVRRFLAMFLPPALLAESKIVVDIHGHVFSAKGKIVQDKGWRVLYPEAVIKDVLLPYLKEHSSVSILGFSIVDRKTTPPKPFTDGDLVPYMENISRHLENNKDKEFLKKKGIGTTATRATIIQSLVDQGYLLRQGVVITSTDIGRKAIKAIPIKALTEPHLTAEWEEKLIDMESHSFSPKTFLQDICAFIQQSIDEISKSAIEPIREKTTTSPSASLSENTKVTISKDKKTTQNTSKRSKSTTKDNCICGGVISSTSKVYSCTKCSRMVWKNGLAFRGKENITEIEAKKILSGGKLSVRLKAQGSGKPYDALVFLGDDGKLKTEFPE